MGNRARPRSRLTTRTVHPHARGEQTQRHCVRSDYGGSSPRTWGTECHLRFRHQRQRFIPTHVGNSCCDVWAGGQRAVHPHARGEQAAAELGVTFYDGSSPRTWGTDPTSPMSESETAVHPHARGEQPPLAQLDSATVGSSPRTWGTDKMGKGRMGALLVHPHARGEQVTGSDGRLSASGSSPRTWGTDVVHSAVRIQLRFIPTHVGNRLKITH